MKYSFDSEYTLSCFREILAVPSPVGYYVQMNPVFKEIAGRIGYDVTFDNKSTAYITVEGEDNSKTVQINAHLDTLGLMVRCINDDGTLGVRQIGGINYSTIEGEYVTVYTRDGRSYTGTLMCTSHSVHVFEDARVALREESNMMVLLDEDVSSKEDVRALGIRHGDIINIEPRLVITDKGYIKTRYIDDKACVACCLTALKYIKDNNLKPKYRTIFAFPYYEEVGAGGRYVSPEVSEVVAVDVGLIGPGYEGSNRRVSICARDLKYPYDYELITLLSNLAEKAGIDYGIDLYYRYGTDAREALLGGNNVKIAVFGMGTYGTHSVERAHIDGINNTTALILAYMLDR